MLQILFCITSNSTLLNPKESSPSSAQSPSTLPLRSLQEILQNRIIQKKREMHKSHNIAYNDSLWTEIETLHWVLAQILMLLRQSTATSPESIPSVPITPAPAPSSSPPSIQEEEEQQKEGKDKIVSKKNLHHRLRLQTMRTQPTIRIFNSTMSRYWI